MEAFFIMLLFLDTIRLSVRERLDKLRRDFLSYIVNLFIFGLVWFGVGGHKVQVSPHGLGQFYSYILLVEIMRVATKEREF